MRVVDLDEPDEDSSDSEVERTLPPPKPAASAKVLTLISPTTINKYIFVITWYIHIIEYLHAAFL